jgi:hypothetical protein
MDLFPLEFRWNLKRALDTGEFKPDDKLDDVTDQWTRIFQCDSLDLVELFAAVEERGRSIRTMGELLRSLDHNGEDDRSTSFTKR